MLVIVFSSILFAFNLVTDNYIRSNVETQLDDLIRSFGTHDDWRADRPPNELQIPDLTGQQRNRSRTRGEVIILSPNYEIIGFNEFITEEDTAELGQIASYLREKGIELASARYVRVDTAEGEYYVSSVEDMKKPGSFFVFYVSVAGINNLVSAIIIAIAVIIAVAMLISFVIANQIACSVTKPRKALSVFAGEIGKGISLETDLGSRISSLTSLGEAMNQSDEKLDLYDKDQRTFFQNVSHELRTPV